MEKILWREFLDSGDPLFYLLYKAACGERDDGSLNNNG